MKTKLDGIEPGAEVNTVNSVNGKTGDVQLNATDVGALPSDTPLFSGKYNDLTNKPVIPSKAEDVGALSSDTPLFSGNYNDLSNKPTLFSGDYNDLKNKPTIPTNNNQLTNGAGYITSSGTSANATKLNGQEASYYLNYNNLSNKPSIPTTASEVNALPDTTKYGASIDLFIDNTTYVVTAQLKDQNGNNLGDAKTIDLPLESVVVSGSYDATNEKVILTLKDGSTIGFSVADLVSGLQSEITSTNKLSVNLISGLSAIATSGALKDATQDANNRTVTDAEKTTWNNKANASDIPTEYVKNAIMQYNHDTDKLKLYIKLSTGGAYETDIPFVEEYIKKATISNNVLKLTNQDGEDITFEGGGGSKIIIRSYDEW
jgi:hypothetical protein